MKHSEQRINEILNEVANRHFLIATLDSISIIYTPSKVGLNTTIRLIGKVNLYLSMVEINKFIDELKSYKLDVDNRFIFFAPIDNLTLCNLPLVKNT